MVQLASLVSVTGHSPEKRSVMNRRRSVALAIVATITATIVGLWTIGTIWPFGIPGPYCPSYIADSNAAYRDDGSVECLYPGVVGSYPVLMIYDPDTGDWTSNRVEPDGSLTILIEDYRPFDPSASYPDRLSR